MYENYINVLIKNKVLSFPLFSNKSNGTSLMLNKPIFIAINPGNIRSFVISFYKQQDVEYDMNFNDLLIAIKEKNFIKIDLIIDEDNIDLSFNENEALLLALYIDSDIIFNKLINCISIQDSLSENYNHVLFSAVQLSREHAVRELLKNYQVSQSAAVNNNYILIESCSAGCQIIFDMLMNINSVQCNVDACKNKALINASFQGYYHIVDRLLKEVRVVDNASDQNNKAIRLAAASGNWNIVSLLASIPDVLEKISVKNNVILRLAVLANEFEWVGWLLSLESVQASIADSENLVLKDSVAGHNIGYVIKILEFSSVFEDVISYREAVKLAAENQDFDIEDLLKRKIIEYNMEQGINELSLAMLPRAVVYEFPIIPMAIPVPIEEYVQMNSAEVDAFPANQGRRLSLPS